MNREVKFRAWDKNRKGYINGFNMFGFSRGQGCPYKKLQRFSDEWKDGDFDLQQFTGLKDKNGKEIYEGDIVKFGQYEYQIIYEIGGFGLLDVAGLMIGKIGGINDHVYSLQVLYLECCWEESSTFDLEVIGNIYENPEFLAQNES